MKDELKKYKMEDDFKINGRQPKTNKTENNLNKIK
jgi:hypothetical protein